MVSPTEVVLNPTRSQFLLTMLVIWLAGTFPSIAPCSPPNSRATKIGEHGFRNVTDVVFKPVAAVNDALTDHSNYVQSLASRSIIYPLM